MTKLAYNCRWCKASHVVQYDESMVRNIDHWLAMLVCNRCGDYMNTRSRISDKIQHACRVLNVAEMTGKPLAHASITEIRQKLEKLTKAMATCVCGYFNLTNVWEPEFVEQLMEKPDKCAVIIKTYIDGLKQIKSQKT